MIFNCIDNQSVEFRITNYQYPDTTDREYDGNWLNIYLNVKSKTENWQSIDPSLATWEVQRIIEWLEELSKNKVPKSNNLEFIEPNLCFSLIENFSDKSKRIRITFELESRPKSAIEGCEYFVDFDAEETELKRLCEELSNELKKFPIRK